MQDIECIHRYDLPDRGRCKYLRTNSGTFSHIMKTLDIQYRQAQSVNIDLGMPDIARVLGKLVDEFPRTCHYRLELARAYVAVGDAASAASQCRKVLSMCLECRNDPGLFEGLGQVEACRP